MFSIAQPIAWQGGGTAPGPLGVVTTEELRRSLRKLTTREDAEIESCIVDAVGALHGPHGRLNRALLRSFWRVTMAEFPSARSFRLPLGNLQQVVSIAYLPETGNAVTMPAGDYIVLTDRLEGEVWLAPGVDWPETRKDHPAAVTVTFEAGYTEIPSDLKRWVKLFAAHLFRNPEGTINEPRVTIVNRALQFGLDYLIAPHRIIPDHS